MVNITCNAIGSCNFTCTELNMTFLPSSEFQSDASYLYTTCPYLIALSTNRVLASNCHSPKMSHPARRLLLLSNSTLHPTGYLEYAQSHITDFFTAADVKKILFVPYALSDHDDYTATASEKLSEWGFEVRSNVAQ